jgi:hypothetical protein
MCTKYRLAFTCVQVQREDENHLHNMIAMASDISFSTFARLCDWTPVARELGYQVGVGNGLRIKDDLYVHFKRSKWNGQRCYFIEWSRIEHVFLPHNLLGD